MTLLRGDVTLIYDAHELESDKGGQNAALAKATLAIERGCWLVVDALISVSPSILEWYGEPFVERPTACVLNVPQCATPECDLYRGPSVRAAVGIDSETPLFVYVGALERGRGIEAAIRAVVGTDMHVALVGDGRLSAEINRWAATSSNIHLCPPVPHDQLVSFIRDADGGLCLIEPVSISDTYCLPNKLFAYVSPGLPDIASQLPEIERMVSSMDLGTCTTLQPEDIREAMRRFLTGEWKPSKEGIEGLSWASQARKLRELYARLRPR